MKNTMRFSSSISLAVPSRRLRLRLPSLFVTVAMLLLLLSIASSSYADSATWKANPGSGDWNTASNWTPQTIPNDISDTATFASSNRTAVSISDVDTGVDGVVFNAGASAFTITVRPQINYGGVLILTFWGVGITNNSGITQKFVTEVNGAGDIGRIDFAGTSTAGDATFINNGGTATDGRRPVTNFLDDSTAGSGTFTNNGSAVSGAYGGFIGFNGTSTAGSGTFKNNGGGATDAGGAETFFFDDSTAGSGTFTNNGGAVSGAYGGWTVFNFNSAAGNAVLIANGGVADSEGGGIIFSDESHGDTARVEVFDNGYLDISYHAAGSVPIGSLEGNGLVFLGANNLTVGTNELSTVFSGVVQDGGQHGGRRGSLTKTGTGKLVLSHPNTYTGATIVKRGKLMVNNTGGSGTGSGPVHVHGGWLGGKGIIAGAVTVGTGSGSGAVLSPGYQHGPNKLGALTIQSTLTFNSDATYEAELNSSITTADQVIANGVTINSGAQFSFADLESGTLTPGTVFTVINNTAATPIAGTFSNLPDGSIFTSNGNTYQVSYQGGDGNDLTLTVVP